jgi:DUF2075 family protein
MRLYSGTTQSLVDDTLKDRVAQKLSEAFFYHFRYNPPPSEVTAWRNSLRAISDVFQVANMRDHGVLLEFQLPHTSKRLDCLVTGYDASRNSSAVIIELKQWERSEEASGENEVVSWVGGQKRDLLHPSAQVGQYKIYLEDNHTAFDEPDPIALRACAYLHNYDIQPGDPLSAPKFLDLVGSYPVFGERQTDELINFFKHPLIIADDGLVLNRIEGGKYRASKKLLEHVAGAIAGKPEYTLLDEQLIAFDQVLANAKDTCQHGAKTVVIVKGGPGTGKSVIAMNLIGKLSAMGYNSHYVTGSRAFTATLQKIIGPRGSAQFKRFSNYQDAEYDSVDVLVCDEAHRMWRVSKTRFRPNTSGKLQIDELLDAGKTCVFFVDDDQPVRCDEIGTSFYIRSAAAKRRSRLFEYELEAQFRCEGAEAYINWINNTLEIKRTPNVLWNVQEEFEFKIFDSPESLDDAIRTKARQGFKSRMSAGYCWFWSKPKKDGTLEPDVCIGAYSRPWNARPDSGFLAKGIPKANIWAYDQGGIDQIGCVYTAQGFEFDYIGVIFGKDLVYDPECGSWKGNPLESFDTVVKRSRDDFLRLVKNTYRVLLTRGIKGCYMLFLDKNTENFFRSRLENTH